jgi:prevent-host-death family protein
VAREELVSLTEARVRLHELIKELEEKNVLLLRHGKPVAVMVGYEAYEGILEHIEDLEDRLAAHEVESDDVGLNVPWDKVKAESGLLAHE